MASTSEDKESEGPSKNQSYDPRLDFYSPKFDPLLALKTPGVIPPDVNAKTFDNLSVYESSKKTNSDAIKSTKRQPKVAVEAQSETFERTWLPHQLPVKSTPKLKTYRNILLQMEQMMGPLSVLARCKIEHIKLQIWTRHSHGIRGYCTAYLAAFDKHWNLALEEVTEVWTRSRRRKVPALKTARESRTSKKNALPKITVTATTAKTETCERHVKQMLLRGEHVAFIVLLEEQTQNTDDPSNIT